MERKSYENPLSFHFNIDYISEIIIKVKCLKISISQSISFFTFMASRAPFLSDSWGGDVFVGTAVTEDGSHLCCSSLEKSLSPDHSEPPQGAVPQQCLFQQE